MSSSDNPHALKSVIDTSSIGLTSNGPSENQQKSSLIGVSTPIINSQPTGKKVLTIRICMYH